MLPLDRWKPGGENFRGLRKMGTKKVLRNSKLNFSSVHSFAGIAIQSGIAVCEILV